MKTASYILGFAILLACASTWAQEGLSELEDSVVDSSSIENETLNIQGNMHEQRVEKKVTEADRARQYRDQLEKKNEELIKMRMQKQRIKAELEMMKKMNKAFDEQLKKLDQM